MTTWSKNKKEAIEHMKNNQVVQEALALDPRLQDVIDRAIAQTAKQKDYNRVQARVPLRNDVVEIFNTNDNLKMNHHYAHVMHAIDDILPSDKVDKADW